MGDYPERSDSEDEHYEGFTGGGSDIFGNKTKKIKHKIVSLFHDEDFRTKITDENKQEFVHIFFYLIQKNEDIDQADRHFYEEFYAYHTMEDANIELTEEDVNKLVEYYEGRLGLEKKSKISFPFHDKEMDVILLLKKGEENETNNEGEEQNNNQETEDQIQGQKMVLKKVVLMKHKKYFLSPPCWKTTVKRIKQRNSTTWLCFISIYINLNRLLNLGN